MARTRWVLWTFLAASACGQDRDTAWVLKQLHDELCDPRRIPSIQEGEAALERLRGWNLAPRRLDEQQRGHLLRVEVYAALAVGDAARAAAKLTQLQDLAPDERETAELAYLVAAAAGDAQAGLAAHKKLSRLLESTERRAISKRRRWIRRVGAQAPDVEITAEDGTKLSARERYGIVLVIDFWNTRQTSEPQVHALKELREAYRSEFRVQFLGINADGKATVEKARRFTREAGCTWPQHYEEKATRPPLTYGAFKAGSPPWTVVIDGKGHIRAVGAVTEPAFHYALRAAVAEATGKFASGKQGKPARRRSGKGDLPSDLEAASLLRQARAFLRAGMKTKAKELLEKIIREYPGTPEALDAEERRQLLP